MPGIKTLTSKFEAAASKLISRLRLGPTSPFPFFRLPGEIRAQIYMHAFGNLTIHLDYLNSKWHQPTPHTLVDNSLDEQGHNWRWRASTCHRDAACHFARDNCPTGLFPTACALHSTPCAAPAALGWLLSSKQAYAEMMPVLYGNKFHMTNCKLLLHGTQIVGVGLSMIVNLELSLSSASIVTYAQRDLDLHPGWPAYRQIIAAFKTTFPALKKLALHIGGSEPVGAEFNCWQGLHMEDGRSQDDPRERQGEEDQSSSEGRALLDPLSQLVRSFDGQLDEARLVTSENCFHRVFARHECLLERLERDEQKRVLRAWCAVPHTASVWKHNEETEAVGLGFWVETFEKNCYCRGAENHGRHCWNKIVWDLPS